MRSDREDIIFKRIPHIFMDERDVCSCLIEAQCLTLK